MNALWRQGDCLLTGLVPVIAPFAEHLLRIRADVVMQMARPLNTYPMRQRIGSEYLAPKVATALSRGFMDLFPRVDVKSHVRQVPGLDYYTVHLELALDRQVSRADVEHALAESPRVCVLPSGVMSTFEIDHLIREPVTRARRDLSPITVFRDTMVPGRGGQASMIELDIAIYSPTIAVYGNIDAIRFITRPGMNPLDAMRVTDTYAHLVTSFASHR